MLSFKTDDLGSWRWPYLDENYKILDVNSKSIFYCDVTYTSDIIVVNFADGTVRFKSSHSVDDVYYFAKKDGKWQYIDSAVHSSFDDEIESLHIMMELVGGKVGPEHLVHPRKCIRDLAFGLLK